MDIRGIGERIRQTLAGIEDVDADGEIRVDFDNIKELIRIFEASGLSEIEIEEGGRRMRLQIDHSRRRQRRGRGRRQAGRSHHQL